MKNDALDALRQGNTRVRLVDVLRLQKQGEIKLVQSDGQVKVIILDRPNNKS